MPTTATKNQREKETATVSITAPNIATMAMTIRGLAPYVQNKFSAKAREMMKQNQEAGQAGRSKRKKEPKDFEAAYQGAIHRSHEGWAGIPAPAFRAAMISACRLVGFKMTLAKLSVFVQPDGFDETDGTPLVRITKGEPEYVEHLVRNETGVADIRPRPMWQPGWEAVLCIDFDADQFTQQDMANLINRVGQQVGIGEGRPDSKKSAGMGWGLFHVVND